MLEYRLRDARSLARNLGHSQESASRLKVIYAQRKFLAKPKPKSHNMKIKVVKEREKNGSLVYKSLKHKVKKLERHLKHQRMFGCYSKFVNSHTKCILCWADTVGTLSWESPRLRVSEQASQPQPWHGYTSIIFCRYPGQLRKTPAKSLSDITVP